MSDRERMIWNERVKLTAAFGNTMGVSAFIACTIVPAVNQGANLAFTHWLRWLIVGLIIATVLHVYSSWHLGKMQ